MFKAGGPSEASPVIPNKDRFGAFVVDDTLTELQKVKKYVQSQLPLQRLVYVKRITACAREVGIDETIIHLSPLLKKLAGDGEAVIRQALGQELGTLAVYCADPAEATNGHDEKSADDDLDDILGRKKSSGASLAAAKKPLEEKKDTPAAASSSSSSSGDAVPAKKAEPVVAIPAVVVTSTDAAAATATTDGATASTTTPPTTDDTSATATTATPSTEPVAAATATAPTPAVSSPAVPLSVTPAVASSSTSPLSPTGVPLDQLSAKELRKLAETKADDFGPMTDVQRKGYSQIKDVIIPCLELLIVDNSIEVRQTTGQSLVQVASVLKGDDVGKIVLTLVLNLAHDERDEQRSTAITLMNDLAPMLGRDLCMNFVALELTAFADDATFRVRKSTAQSFGNVCKVVGPTFTVNRLLPPYVKLSKDMIWGVRKGCVDSMVAVAAAVPPDVRKTVFIPMFERFAKDASRWVRNGAFEILGPLIHTLGSKLVRKTFLKHFTGIPYMGHSVVDAEVNYHCAYNFPAVVLTLGPHRWPELLECFETLAKDSKFPVRRTLACSLHEIAHVLRTNLTERHVLPVLDAFLKDLDEVRFGVIKNLSRIIKVVSPTKRAEYIKTLWEVQASENWRWRQHLARQMGRLALLYTPDLTVSAIVPLFFHLCRDRVAAVRNVAAAAIGYLLHRLTIIRPAAVKDVITQILAFFTSKIYHERQSFVRMCEGMLGVVDQKLFEEEFLEKLSSLAGDKTVNVRLYLAHVAYQLVHHSHFGTSVHVRGMVNVLSGDVDKDVIKYTRSGAPDHEGEDRDLPDRPDTTEMDEIVAMERLFAEGKTEELPPRGDDDDSDDDVPTPAVTTETKLEARPNGVPAKTPASPAASGVRLPPIALGSLTAGGAAAASSATNGDVSPKARHVDTPREPGPTEHPLAGLGSATLRVTERKDTIPSSPTSAAVVAAAVAAATTNGVSTSSPPQAATPRPESAHMADLLDSADIIGS